MMKKRILLISFCVLLITAGCIRPPQKSREAIPRYQAPKYRVEVKDIPRKGVDIYLDFFIGMVMVFFAGLIREWVL